MIHFLKDNQKYLTYKNLFDNNYIKYEVIKEIKTAYFILVDGNKVKVSKSTGRELCPNNCSRICINLGRYHNEDGSTFNFKEDF